MLTEDILKTKQDVQYVQARSQKDGKNIQQYFFYSKKDKIVYELIDRRYLIKTDLKFENLPKHTGYYLIKSEFIHAIFCQYRGYVYQKDNWTYSISLVESPYFKNNSNARLLRYHGMFGNNLIHELKVDGQVISGFSYYKTRLVQNNLIDNFVKYHCIPSTAVGFKNICPSMFRQLDIVKRNSKMEVKNKEDLMIALTLKKLFR